MAEKKSPRNDAKTGQSRDERLKAALKANLARRKAQMRARAAGSKVVADDRGRNTGKSEG